MDSTVMDFPLTMGHIWWRAQKLFQDQRIVSRSAEGVKSYTYNDCFSRVRKLAPALSTIGVHEREVVGSVAWNHREHLELYLAATMMGSVLHTVNVRFHPAEMKRVIDEGGDKALFIDQDVAEALRAHKTSFKNVRRIVNFQSGDYESLLEGQDEISDFPQMSELQAAIMCNTSGTTGSSKGVVYSHRSVYLHSLTLLGADVLGISANDCVMPIVPMFHISAWDIPFASLLAGAAIVLPGPRPRPEDLVNLIEKEKVTITAAAPTMLIELVQYLEQEKHNISSLRRVVTGGSEPPVGLVRKLQEKWGIDIVHVWGMTETEAVSSVNRSPVPEKLVRQGTPIPGLEIRILDKEGKELPWDGVSMGVLQVRGAWVTGRYAREDSSDSAFVSSRDKTWLKTGDIVTIDASGSIKIVDREKDMIRSGAEWISSIDLENSLMTHPGVLEAVVIARPDEKWGERPYAFVVVRVGFENETTPESLKRYLESLNRFPHWWIPNDIEFIEAIPKTSTGKMDKKSVRKMLVGSS